MVCHLSCSSHELLRRLHHPDNGGRAEYHPRGKHSSAFRLALSSDAKKNQPLSKTLETLGVLFNLKRQAEGPSSAIRLQNLLPRGVPPAPQHLRAVLSHSNRVTASQQPAPLRRACSSCRISRRGTGASAAKGRTEGEKPLEESALPLVCGWSRVRQVRWTTLWFCSCGTLFHVRQGC